MGPRLFGIPAIAAPVVAIIRRGPSDWCHVGRWDYASGTWESGSWIRGAIYPQRCDVSPDGRLLASFILKATADWAPGRTYVAVSRLPWLAALAAWGTGGTWSRGMAFVASGSAVYPPDPPDVGDLRPLAGRYDLEHRRPASYAVERARGWTETVDSAPATDDDPWDVWRAGRITMMKSRPTEPATSLLVTGAYAAHRGGEPSADPARYRVRTAAGAVALEGVQWADWAPDGRLLVATRAGSLEVRDDPGETTPAWRVDLAEERPQAVEPPSEAHEW